MPQEDIIEQAQRIIFEEREKIRKVQSVLGSVVERYVVKLKPPFSNREILKAIGSDVKLTADEVESIIEESHRIALWAR